MPLTDRQKKNIKQNIELILKLESKVQENSVAIANGDVSPFLLSLLGVKTSLLVKFGQSLQTTMGMMFYEQTCKLLAEEVGFSAKLQKKCLGFLTPEVEQYLNSLNSITYVPNRKQELETIRTLYRKSVSYDPVEYPDSTVDVYITTDQGVEILIDIKTVKFNKSTAIAQKAKTLRWAAYRMSQNPDVKIEPYFAIPYNPEGGNIESTSYRRMARYYDRSDILVGEELWMKVSNNTCSISDIAEIFSELGDEIRENIDRILSSLQS